MDTSLRHSFDEAASIYAEVRPRYPEEIIQTIIAQSGLKNDGTILEVGVGTGQITLPFAKKGYSILGLELGVNLTEQARQHLQAYPNVTIEQADFEIWNSDKTFDLLLSAQAFHWINVEKGLKQALHFLNSSGAVALVWTLDESVNTDFYKSTDPIYKKYIPEQPNRPTPITGYARYKAALEAHPLFKNISEYSVSWEKTHSKSEYIKLLNTFSDHRVLTQDIREAFNQELSKVIDDYGGTVPIVYKTVLLLAYRACQD